MTDTVDDGDQHLKGTGKWAQSGVPHRGWKCIGIRDDDGEEPARCEMCELRTVRYVHVMRHPDYPGTLEVGRVCAAIMGVEYAPVRQPEVKVNGNIVTVASGRHGMRVFQLVGTRPYRRRDGTETILKVWEGRCVICGAPFEVATPENATGSKSFEMTTCQVHRRARQRETVA
jgi:hypothetical protein